MKYIGLFLTIIGGCGALLAFASIVGRHLRRLARRNERTGSRYPARFFRDRGMM